MEQRKDIPTFRQDRYTEDKIYLENETHYDLMCDFGTIEEVCECIEYVTESQTRENDRAVTSDFSPNSEWYGYAKYFMACKTAKYLADYALTLFNELEEKFDVDMSLPKRKSE